MLGLAATIVFALFIFGPYTVFRLILGFAVPRRIITLTRSEEFARAALLGSFGNLLAFSWAKYAGHLGRQFSSSSFMTCFAGIYSEQFFREHLPLWFASAARVSSGGMMVLWRLYLVVTILAVALSLIMHHYAWCREKLPKSFRPLMASLLLPQIAPWHILLSTTLLKSHQQLYLDVLTKADLLYQGRLHEKMLNADGTLISISLANPKRFDRPAYVEAKGTSPKLLKEDFWKEIPTDVFVVMASEIQTINLRYAPKDMAALKRVRETEHLKKALAMLAQELEGRNG